MSFEANLESLNQHQVPEWYHDAKLGIFVHWGLYSVPAYAPTDYGDVNETHKRGGRFHFAHNPYAEWYLNSLKFVDGPYRAYHERTFGAGFSYDDFAPAFNAEIARWDPGQMAGVFSQVGARYVVLTTKHHDGFTLWPSDTPNPHKEDYHASRDIVGELSQAVRARGMRMGVYYSGALDWSFATRTIEGLVGLASTGPISPAYARYVDAHLCELIDKVEPSILWNDIGYPPDGDLEGVISDFYNRIEEGVINDRWYKTGRWLKRLLRLWPVGALAEWGISRLLARAETWVGELPTRHHWDFRTPEYATYPEIKAYKWECCRGIGRSFGYNRMERDEHHISVTDLIHSFVDIVSKNGNLLLNVGPMADGTIPDLQLKRLQGLGEWLHVNGEAIFGTRPWTRAEGITREGIAVRFTSKADALYALLLGKPQGDRLVIQNLEVAASSTIRMLGSTNLLSWTQEGADLSIALPPRMPESCAFAFQIAGQ